MKIDNGILYKTTEDMLMNITICDDEKSTCAELENSILEYASEKCVGIDVDVYFSGEKLVGDMQNGQKIDVLFLDIQLPGIDGVGVGSFIRSVMENEQMFIVYISSNEQYALQLFQNRPFDFLVKPIKKADIFRILDNIFKMIGKDNIFFEYQNNRKFYRIPYRDILYFQSTGKTVDIIMKTGVKSFCEKLSVVRKKLPEYLFLSIHKSYLINYNYVEVYAYEWVKMLNGDILNISQNNRSVVRKKILEREKDGLSAN